MNEFINVNNLYKFPAEPILFENDQKSRLNNVNGPLTACYNTLLYHNTKMAFGLPSDFLNMENLVLNSSLIKLRHIFYTSLQGSHKDIYQANPELYLEDNRLLYRLQEFSMREFPDELYRYGKKRSNVFSRFSFGINLSKRHRSHNFDARKPCFFVWKNDVFLLEKQRLIL